MGVVIVFFLICLMILVAKIWFICRILKANADVNVFNHSIAIVLAVSGTTLKSCFYKMVPNFFPGIMGIVCIPMNIWLTTVHSEASLAVETWNNSAHGEDAVYAYRLLPCSILILVRIQLLLFLILINFLTGEGQPDNRDQHHLQLEHRLQILHCCLRRRLCQKGSA